jgi:hypothetical protein
MTSLEIDKILRELQEPESTWVIMHPKIWNGYWYIDSKIPKIIMNLFRSVGRFFHNKYLYWIGLPIRWEAGMKEYIKQ